ncbi:hypothetical protein MKX03_003486, partial [Papaver bracteatum]
MSCALSNGVSSIASALRVFLRDLLKPGPMECKLIKFLCIHGPAGTLRLKVEIVASFVN